MATDVTPLPFAHGSRCDWPAWRPPVELQLGAAPPHPCPYLPGRDAITRAFYVHNLSGETYHAFMDRGFRRSGKVIYQPICAGCRRCIPLRVPVDSFHPDKTQRRHVRRNADLRLTIGLPEPTDEKFDLYRKYQADWHGSTKQDTRDEFESFLYDSPVETIEFCHRDLAGRLLAVGICDVCSRSLSSVYFYFDPDEHRRGLGTFGALCEIDFARAHRIPFYYLGYWVRGCGSMDYKANFRPHEILCPDGTWRSEADGSAHLQRHPANAESDAPQARPSLPDPVRHPAGDEAASGDAGRL